MDNQEFLESIGVPAENREKCLNAMEKYADNKWWEQDVDPRKFAYYQMHEPILLSNFSHFHESIKLLLGRPVYTHEFGISADKLRQEVERAWTYQVGVTSDAERQERVQGAIEELASWAKAKNKAFVQINLPREQCKNN